MAAPLSRFRVLDLTHARAGPVAVRQFADWGADVLMIESPASGQITGRRDGSDFQNLHRGKRSMTLNLKSGPGLEIFYRLVRDADVLFENFRPDVKRRLGIDYATLREINPRLVYVSISGYGEEGPYRDRPCVDQIMQGMAGLMSITGLPEQGPVRAGIAISDCAAGIYAAQGAMMALLEREMTGQGRWVRTSLLQSLIAMEDFQAARWLMDGEVPEQAGNEHPTIAAMGLFEAADAPVNIAPAGPGQFESLCRVAGLEGLLDDPRFTDYAARSRNRDVLNRELSAKFSERPAAYWIERLNEAGVPCGPVNKMDQVFADPQVESLGIARTVEHPRLGRLQLVGQPIDLAGTEPAIADAAPELGADTDEVLESLGYGRDDVLALRREAAV